MWPIFGSLWRTLAGGPAPAVPPDPDAVAPLAQVGLSHDEIRALLASDALEPYFTYSRFRKPKRAGGWREIAEPDPRLKSIQKQIVRQFLAAEVAHPAALAYQFGKCAAHHARAHAGAEVIVTADVRDFFPTTRAARVEEWWRGKLGTDAARAFALLTTDRGGLPQGAPTSPALSNIVNAELDARLDARATAAGARYTRYCDDLAFSWRRGDGPRSDFERGVRAVLHEFGYALHPTKGWLVHALRDEPEITGVVLARGGGVRLPERVRRVMRKLARSTDPHDRARLDGYLGYEEMVLGKHKRKRRPIARPAPPQPTGNDSSDPIPF